MTAKMTTPASETNQCRLGCKLPLADRRYLVSRDVEECSGGITKIGWLLWTIIWALALEINSYYWELGRWTPGRRHLPGYLWEGTSRGTMAPAHSQPGPL